MRLRAECHGNPDHGQYSPPGEDLDIHVDNWEEASLAFRAWITVWNLGAGNTGEGRVVEEPGVVATVSYNGKVWPPGEWTPGRVPLYVPVRSDDPKVRRRVARDVKAMESLLRACSAR
jgi:hypothetical protein